MRAMRSQIDAAFPSPSPRARRVMPLARSPGRTSSSGNPLVSRSGRESHTAGAPWSTEIRTVHGIADWTAVIFAPLSDRAAATCRCKGSLVWRCSRRRGVAAEGICLRRAAGRTTYPGCAAQANLRDPCRAKSKRAIRCLAFSRQLAQDRESVTLFCSSRVHRERLMPARGSRAVGPPGPPRGRDLGGRRDRLTCESDSAPCRTRARRCPAGATDGGAGVRKCAFLARDCAPPAGPFFVE